jgi:hypothetical protein
VITGWPPGLMQDDCKKLSQWLSTRVDARHVHRINMEKQMNLYLLTGTASGYDTYGACVVAAPSEDVARSIHPSGFLSSWAYRDWAKQPNDVKAVLIGTASEDTEQGVICASFNAGYSPNQGNK